MNYPHGGASEIWRDDNGHNPVKSEIRDWGGVVEASAELTPYAMGAVGDGIKDDTAALQAYVANLKASGLPFVGQPGAIYKITDPNGLWLGSDDTTNTVRGFYANGSTILIAVDGGVGVDLTGIQNGKRDEYDIRVEVASGFAAAHGVVQARPKQASGVVSSGNVGKIKVNVIGAMHGAGYYNVQSESNVQPSSFVQNDAGPCYVWSEDDWFSGKTTITLDGSVDAYTIGNTLDNGSGATGIILRADGNRMFVHVLGGTFSDGDTVTDGATGTGAISGTPVVLGSASPNSTLGVEETSTSTFQHVKDIWGNNNHADKLWPVRLIRSFNDMTFDNTNLNHADGGDLSELHGDCGVVDNGTYLHAAHRYSHVFGDLADATSQVMDRCKFVGLNAGSPLTRVKVMTNLVRFEDCLFDLDGDLDFAGAGLNGATSIRLGAHAMTATGRVEGSISYDSQGGADLTGYTSASDDKRAVLFDSSTGLYGFRREVSEVIDVGRIPASGNIIRVAPETGLADDLTHIDVPPGVVIDGSIIGLQVVSGSITITIKPGVDGGNIRTADNKRIIMKADVVYPFIYDARQNEFSFAGMTNGDPAQTGFTGMTGTSSKAALAAYAAPTISATPTQAEVQAVADALQALAQRVKAQDDAAIAANVMST